MKLEECEMSADEKSRYMHNMKENNWRSVCVFCFVEAREINIEGYAGMSCPVCHDWKGVVEL